MSARKWMPLYVGDFLADTMHLSAVETGIYIRLIMHAWQHGGVLPRDDQKLRIIAHVDHRTWRKYRQTMLDLCSIIDAFTMQQNRVVKELHRAAEISSKRKAAGQQKHKQNKSKKSAIAHTRAHVTLQSQESPLPPFDKPAGELAGARMNGALARPATIHVTIDTPEWRICASRYRAEKGCDPPQDNTFGWDFPADWLGQSK